MPAEITQRVNAGGGSSGSASPAATRVAVKAANKQPNPKSAFFTQTIPAWTPILTPFWIYVILGSTGVAFIAIGIALKLASDGVVELRRQYDGAGAEAPACAAPLQGGAPTRCTLSFTVPAAMKAPVFVYYELTNFYQNHRRYVQSRSNEQLAGALLPAASLTSACSPLVSAPNGKTLHPCGLIANSLFNGACGGARRRQRRQPPPGVGRSSPPAPLSFPRALTPPSSPLFSLPRPLQTPSARSTPAASPPAAPRPAAPPAATPWAGRRPTLRGPLTGTRSSSPLPRPITPRSLAPFSS